MASRYARRTMIQAAGGAALAGLTSFRAPRRAAAQATPEAGSPASLGEEAVTIDSVDRAIVLLDPIIADALTKTGVPGMSLAIVHEDRVVYTNGFGVRSVDAPDPVSAETVFQLASVSKTITSTIVSALVGDGVVTWDDPVGSHLSDFELADPWVTREVTIRDCFSHRTGMAGTAGDDLEALGYSRAEIIHQMRYLPLTGAFRQTYSYSNFGLTLGAESAAEAAGAPWEEIADTRLYQPLGMVNTSSRHADFVARENRAALHVFQNGAWVQAFERDADPQSPAGGVSSNVIDLAQWVRLLLGNGTFDGVEMIDADALVEAHTPQIVRGANPATGAPGYYGLGWNVDYDEQGRIFLDHAGAFSVGARTLVKLLPEAQLGIVILTNAFPTGLPEGIADSFFDLVLLGEPSRDWVSFWGGLYDQLVASVAQAAAAYATPPDNPDPARPLDAYAGTYTNDYFGELTVSASADDTLVMTIGPAAVSYPLQHWDRDLFIYEATPDLPGVMASATFVLDPNGNATQVIVDGLNSYGLGTFTRAGTEQ